MKEWHLLNAIWTHEFKLIKYDNWCYMVCSNQFANKYLLFWKDWLWREIVLHIASSCSPTYADLYPLVGFTEIIASDEHCFTTYSKKCMGLSWINCLGESKIALVKCTSVDERATFLCFQELYETAPSDKVNTYSEYYFRSISIFPIYVKVNHYVLSLFEINKSSVRFCSVR